MKIPAFLLPRAAITVMWCGGAVFLVLAGAFGAQVLLIPAAGLALSSAVAEVTLWNVHRGAKAVQLATRVEVETLLAEHDGLAAATDLTPDQLARWVEVMRKLGWYRMATDLQRKIEAQS